MDLTTEGADFCYEWLKGKLDGKPDGNNSLTWFVPARVLYVDYARAASRDRVRPLDMAGFWAVMRLLFPKVESGRLWEPMFFGVRLKDDPPDVKSDGPKS